MSGSEVAGRGRRLHFDSFVFDFSPHGMPIPHTERARAAMRGALDTGGLSEALRSLWSEYFRELEESPAAVEAAAADWRRSGVDAVQVTLGAMEHGIHDWDATLRDASRWYRLASIGGHTICTTANELAEARREGQVGILLGIQDTLQIGSDLGRLETLYGLGLRVVQLTYNRRNLVGDGCTERHQSGLSQFGLDLLGELNLHRIVVDVSHCGRETTDEVLEKSDQPPAFTHVTCRALYDHARGKPDDQLRTLAERDGYVGIVAVPHFLADGGATIDDLVDQVEHAAEVVGIERVGIATDWGFWSTDFPTELHDLARRAIRGTAGFRPEDGLSAGVGLGEFVAWHDWPQITGRLVARGFTEAEVQGVIGGNWLRYLSRVQAG
ncbi:MAG: membrane dipeptidase [Actinobacteria bacterium]|nr:membrane dipeptidase [Actinomycetota bacterium]